MIVTTPHIRTLIRNGIVSLLQGIVAGQTIYTPDGSNYTYNTAFGDVTDTPKDPENFSGWPGVNVTFGKDFCKNRIRDPGTMNRQVLENGVQLILTIFGVTVENVNTYLEGILSDLLTAIGNNSTLGGLVQTIVYLQSDKQDLTSVSPNCQMEVIFDIYYRQLRGNPCQLI